MLHYPRWLAERQPEWSDVEKWEARRQQAGIIKLLLERGARPTDQDARGKRVYQAATSEWIRALLSEAKSG